MEGRRAILEYPGKHTEIRPSSLQGMLFEDDETFYHYAKYNDGTPMSKRLRDKKNGRAKACWRA
jgi:hypothetical protein